MVILNKLVVVVYQSSYYLYDHRKNNKYLRYNEQVCLMNVILKIQNP